MFNALEDDNLEHLINKIFLYLFILFVRLSFEFICIFLKNLP